MRLQPRIAGRRYLRDTTQEIPELRFRLNNFGPISNADIYLKPLTLFVGPNSCGKSYTAMFLHSVFLAHTGEATHWLSHRRRVLVDFRAGLVPAEEKHVSALLAQASKLPPGGSLPVPPEIVQDAADATLANLYGKRLQDALEYSYASSVRDLIAIEKPHFRVDIETPHYAAHLRSYRGKIRVEASTTGAPQVVAQADGGKRGVRVGSDKDSIIIHLPLAAELLEEDAEDEARWRLTQVLERIISGKTWDQLLVECHYLPAARSGILQAHRQLVGYIARMAARAGTERRREIPPYSGVVADFIATIVQLTTEEKGPLYRLTGQIEEKLIGGRIVMQESQEIPYPEIQYEFRDTAIPMHRTSSSVSELAPLFLYLKYIVSPGQVLIIEEPEAHLHPENQRILAQLLVRLVRSNVHVVLTTHSEYLVEQLSSFILLSNVSKKDRVEKYKYGADDFLRPDEVGAYVFSFDPRRKGYKTQQVEVTAEDGISQEEFLRIHEVLYQESFKLRDGLSRQD